ncbi:MAG: phosphatidate phosphatase App1 family protein [Planctomycetota bacterium]|jgi:phosphatidate phosphatase APP1
MSRSEVQSSDNIRVDLFTTCGHLDTTRREWVVPVQGRIYRLETDSRKRRAASAAMRRALDIDEHDETDTFRRRAHNFMARNVEGIRPGIELCGVTTICNPSKRNGVFEGCVRLVESAIDSQNPAQRRMHASLPHESTHAAERDVSFIAPRGLSVISDIDDTVRVTNVRRKREMLLNTFAREFRPVRGMVEWYQELRAEGASVHYVSSSPWQLHDELLAFFTRVGLPADEIMLRTLRAKDPSIIRFFQSSERHKPDTIRSILDRFPQRGFILVGDAFENDESIYTTIARERPDQIQRVRIVDQSGVCEA